jgi:tetratricopeptide (TPR) repeat protein
MFRGAQSGGATARQTSAPEPAPPPPAKIESLVVMPLATEGAGEELSYLAEGVAEDLIRSVGQLGKARVTALTSARKLAGRADDYAEIRRALHADFLLAGRAGENGGALTVNVYLTDLRSGARVWEDSYVSPSGDLLQVRNALFVLLSSRLQTMLAGDKQLPLPPASTLNAEAYRAYLRGAYARDRHSVEGLRRAVASLEHAVSLDPNFAMAYSALGDSYNLLGSFMGESPYENLPRARKAVLRAIALDDTLAPAHASLAKMRMDYDRDWAGAEREFRRAIELNPNYAQAHHWYGEVYLSAMGRLEESLRELQAAHEQDPLSDGILTGLAWSHMGAGDYERAVAECREALALDPQNWDNYSYLSMAQLKLGRYDEAVQSAKTAYELERTGGNLAMLGAMLAYAGNRQEASRILRNLRAAPGSLNVSKYDLAVVHTALGVRDEAFRLLGEEVATLSVDLLSIRIDPMLDPLRDDPRFPPLEARYNFPPDPRRAPGPPGASALRF